MKMNQRFLECLELDDLRQRLMEAEETLDSIRGGAVDALVVSGPNGEKVFTVEGAEHPYRVLVESMNEGAISLAADGTILYCNSAFAHMINVPLDQTMSRDVSEFVLAGERDSLRRLIKQGSHEAVRAEMTLLGSLQATVPTQFSLNPVKLEEGLSIGVIVTDLSERKRNEQAAAAVQMPDKFLAIASHELRTPLSTLVLRLGLLERYLEQGDLAQLQPGVRRAQDQAERMGQLVDRLLDVSQLASGRLKLDLEPCDLGEIVAEVAERLSEQAATAGSELRVNVSSGIATLSDKFRLDEALSNIVSNAIKYGAGRPVNIQLKATAAKATLVIHDRGIGIPTEDLSRIFGRFERTAVSKNYGGLGLGLYIASQIIEQHQGSIKAESSAKGGTRFVIEMPRIVNSVATGRT